MDFFILAPVALEVGAGVSLGQDSRYKFFFVPFLHFFSLQYGLVLKKGGQKEGAGFGVPFLSIFFFLLYLYSIPPP